jgi:hypothetical protein
VVQSAAARRHHPEGDGSPPPTVASVGGATAVASRDGARLSRVGGILEPVGGLAIVASAFLPWVARGLGSTVDLHDLGDLVLGGTVSAVIPRWIGLVAYVIPAIGALLIVSSGVEPGWARRTSAVLALGALVLTAVATILPFTRHAHPWLGQAVAGAGAVAACVGATLRRNRRSRLVQTA